MSLRDDLLPLLPDVPRTLEMRALLLDPQTRISGDPSGAVLVNDAEHEIVLLERPTAAILRVALAHATSGWSVLSLCLRPELPIRWARATISTLQDEERFARVAALARERASLLEERDLTLVDDAYRDELRGALREGMVACVRVAGRPVSFAYAGFLSERWADLGVDTEEAFRGKGYARLAAAAIVVEQRRLGREPVWCALDENPPSGAVAGALGFTPDSHIFVGEREDGGGVAEPRMEAEGGASG